MEVGGTVGDIEGQPFLEAIRQLRHEVGRDDALFIHVTYLPYISPTQELKTKPTQHSVKELRGLGIQPDIIICRSDYDVPEEVKEKISLFCDVERRAVIHLPTVETIYEVQKKSTFEPGLSKRKIEIYRGIGQPVEININSTRLEHL